MPQRSANGKKSTQAPDVAADNPEGTLDRFTAGLQKVLTVPKGALRKRKRRSAHRAR